MDTLSVQKMSEYNGDDLLKVFELINIKANPNYARGLFDTDDKNIKNLLSWLCSSLSSDNYVPPLEEQAFTCIAEPLVGQKYEEAVERVENYYPGIFDLEDNLLDSELLQDEIDILLKEELDLNNLIRMNESLQTNLIKELNMQTALEISSAAQLKCIQDQSNDLANELDTLNERIHSQIVKYARHLRDFEYSSVPCFINNMDITQIEDKFNNLAMSLGPILDAPSAARNNSISICTTSSFDSTNLSETANSDLWILRERILCSQQNYLFSKLEVEKYNEILHYINQLTVEDVLYMKENDNYQHRETKEEERKTMCVTLNKIATKFSDDKIAYTKLKYLQRELDLVNLKFNNISEIFNITLKLLSMYISLSIMYQQEKKDICSSDSFFRTICKEPVLSLNRIQKMNKTIEEYTVNIEENKLKLVKTISKMLTGEECDMDRTFAAVVEFRSQLKELEDKLFNINFINHRSTLNNLVDNANTLQRFLVCGPTHRIVLIPADLHNLIRTVEQMLKKQKLAVKSAFDICTSFKKSTNEWQNYRRQLWMYFYSDPQKIDFILQKIEDEFTKNKMKEDLMH